MLMPEGGQYTGWQDIGIDAKACQFASINTHYGVESWSLLRAATALGQKGIMSFLFEMHISAQWQSGYAADCKSVYPGSIPSCASSNHAGFGRFYFPRRFAKLNSALIVRA